MIIKLLLILTVLALVGGVEVTIATEENILKVGMQDEPMTLNPFYARDTWSWKVLGLILESLYGYDPNLELIPLVADGWPEYEDGTALVRLKEGVLFHDGTPLRAEDVAFTAKMIMHFKFPMLYYKFEFIEKVEVVDEHTLRYHFDQDFLKGKMTPIFLTDTLTTFIVQKKQWEPIFKEALTKPDPLSWFWEQQPEPLISAGPFKFERWSRGRYVFLRRNENYHLSGKEVGGRVVGPYIDSILYYIYRTTDLAALALKRGEIDYIWWPIYPALIEDLERDPQIVISTNKSNGFFYLAFNLRKAPFNDKSFRKALNYLIDREFIVKRVLWGRGEPLYTVVPPGNEYWHNPNVPTPGKGMSRAEREVRAKEILSYAGYSWQQGRLIMPDGSPVEEIIILTPPADYDPLRWMATMLIQKWFSDIGLRVIARPIAFAELVHRVFDKVDFEAYVLGWGLGIDPDYVRIFFHSRYIQPGGFNCMGYSNPDFDRIAEESMLTMDKQARRELIFQMQEILMEELPYFPLYVLEIVEARSKRFEGWVQQLGGIGNSWSFVFMEPAE